MTTNDGSGDCRYEPFSTQNPEDLPEQIVLARLRPDHDEARDDLVHAADDADAALHDANGKLDAALEDANDKLMALGSGWRLEREQEGTQGFVAPIRVTYDHAVQSRPIADLSELVSTLPDQIPLVVEAMLVPSPGSKPHSPISSPSFGTHAITRADFGRVPVAVLAEEPPPRRTPKELSGRRPVVALLETAVEAHEWLGEADANLDGDGFWVDARSMGWNPGPRLRPSQTANGWELEEVEGHGTFSAGLVRQVAPDAKVLAVQVIRDDGRIYGDHVLNALYWLWEKAGLVEGDVVCVPAGFRPFFPTDRPFLGLLGEVLARLASRGIRVVAAAGNDGSTDPVYPAAFAASKGVPERVRLVSVGATNADGKTPAYLSNYGEWVTRWETGTSVVSTFPRVNRAALPELVAEPRRKDPAGFAGRESADPDDFTGGFARWSGTSFAATVCAAKLAREGIRPARGAGAEARVLR